MVHVLGANNRYGRNGAAREPGPRGAGKKSFRSANNVAGLFQGCNAIASAAVNVSVGAAPPGGVEAANSLLQASDLTRVMQPANKSPSVLKIDRSVVCVLFKGSWITGPKPPVARSTKLGTLPAAILKPSA